MKAIDRRIGNDRRSAERIEVSVEIEWANETGVRRATLSDVSSGGCFVLTAGEVADGEVVRLLFPLSDGARVEFLGEVTNHVPEIGFAARFVGLTNLQREFLQNFAELHQKS